MEGRRAAKRVLIGTVALAGLVFYAFFFLLVIPDEDTASEGHLHLRMVEDDDERAGEEHLVTVRAWSNEQHAIMVTLHHGPTPEGPFQALRMQRVGQGDTFAVEMQPLPEGTRAFFFIEAVAGDGTSARLPENAPAPPLLYVRWEGHVVPVILSLHIALMIGALFFLVHGLHYSGRVLAAKTGQAGLAAKAHSAVLWGWLSFFIGGIPLGIYVSGTALGWGNAWGGWPLGIDITDTKTEVLIVYWGVVLAVRANDLPILGDRLRAFASERRFAQLVLGGAVLTAAVYAIPHSLFFQ